MTIHQFKPQAFKTRNSGTLYPKSPTNSSGSQDNCWLCVIAHLLHVTEAEITHLITVWPTNYQIPLIPLRTQIINLIGINNYTEIPFNPLSIGEAFIKMELRSNNRGLRA